MEKPTVWRTAKGEIIPIPEVADIHIERIINCLLGKGQLTIPDGYQGLTKAEWLEVFDHEQRRRQVKDKYLVIS